MPAEDIDALENYVLEFGLRGEKIWTQDKTWTWHRHSVAEPADGKPSASEIERIEKIDAIRRKAIQPLINFSNAIKKKKSAREFATALYNFLEDLKIPERLQNLSDAEESKGNLSPAKEHLAVWEGIVNLLEQIVDALEDFTIDAREFETIIAEGLDALELNLIPPGLNEVTVAQFDQNALQNSKAIFVLGFGDNNFPKQATEKFLLTDADRIHLNEDFHVKISLGGRETVFAEKFLIYRGLTEARNYLYISYPLADAEGKAARPANLKNKFLQIFPDLKVETANLDILESLGSEVDLIAGERKISANLAKELFAPHKKITGSVTRFESFNSCPFQYFANFGLNLKERREFKVQSADIGNFLDTTRFLGMRISSQIRWA